MDYHIPILMSATGPFRYCKDGFHDSASYRRDTFRCGPSPISYARGLFFVVINGGQAQQGGSRLGEGPAHRTASLHALNKAKPLQQLEPIA